MTHPECGKCSKWILEGTLCYRCEARAIEKIVAVALDAKFVIVATHVGEFDEKKVKSCEDVDGAILETLTIEF